MNKIQILWDVSQNVNW